MRKILAVLLLGTALLSRSLPAGEGPFSVGIVLESFDGRLREEPGALVLQAEITGRAVREKPSPGNAIPGLPLFPADVGLIAPKCSGAGARILRTPEGYSLLADREGTFSLEFSARLPVREEGGERRALVHLPPAPARRLTLELSRPGGRMLAPEGGPTEEGGREFELFLPAGDRVELRWTCQAAVSTAPAARWKVRLLVRAGVVLAEEEWEWEIAGSDLPPVGLVLPEGRRLLSVETSGDWERQGKEGRSLSLRFPGLRRASARLRTETLFPFPGKTGFSPCLPDPAGKVSGELLVETDEVALSGQVCPGGRSAGAGESARFLFAQGKGSWEAAVSVRQFPLASRLAVALRGEGGRWRLRSRLTLDPGRHACRRVSLRWDAGWKLSAPPRLQETSSLAWYWFRPPDRLELQFPRPLTGTIRLDLEAEREADPVPLTRGWALGEPENASPLEGSVEVFPGRDCRLSAVFPRGLSQGGNTEAAAASTAEPAEKVFRIDAAAPLLAAASEPLAASLDAELSTAVSFPPDEIREEIAIRGSVEKVPIFALDWKLPPGTQVADLTGDPLPSWHLAPDGRMRLRFPAGLLGPFRISLRVYRRRDRSERIAWDGLGWEGPRKLARKVVLREFPGHEIKAGGVAGLRPTPLPPPAAVPAAVGDGGRAVLAFEGEEAGAGLELTLIELPAVLSIRQESSCQVKLGEIAVTTTLHGQLRQGGIDRLEFYLPEGLEEVEAAGEGVLRLEGEGGKRTLRWENKQYREWEVSVAGRIPWEMGKALVLGEIWPAELTFPSEAALLVTKDTPKVEVTLAAFQGYQETPGAASAPPVSGGDRVGSLSYQGKERPSVTLKFLTHASQAVGDVKVGQERIETLLQEAGEGAALAVSCWEGTVRSEGTPFLKVGWNPEWKLWGTYLDGQPVKPREDGEGHLLVPLPGRKASRFRVVWEEEKGRKGRIHLSAPVLPAGGESLGWKVFLPASTRLLEWGGGFVLEQDEGWQPSLAGQAIELILALWWAWGCGFGGYYFFRWLYRRWGGGSLAWILAKAVVVLLVLGSLAVLIIPSFLGGRSDRRYAFLSHQRTAPQSAMAPGEAPSLPLPVAPPASAAPMPPRKPAKDKAGGKRAEKLDNAKEATDDQDAVLPDALLFGKSRSDAPRAEPEGFARLRSRKNSLVDLGSGESVAGRALGALPIALGELPREGARRMVFTKRLRTGRDRLTLYLAPASWHLVGQLLAALAAGWLLVRAAGKGNFAGLLPVLGAAALAAALSWLLAGESRYYGFALLLVLFPGGLWRFARLTWERRRS